MADASPPPSTEYWVYIGTFPGQSSKGIYVSRLDGNGTLTQPQLAAENDRPVFLVADRRHRFLYAANETSSFKNTQGGSISAFAIDAKTGRLKLLNQESAIARGPDHIDIDATGRAVMVANYDGSSVTSFPVKSDGTVGPAASFIPQHGSSVVPGRQDAPHAHAINIDPGNHFALVCDLGLDEVLVFKLDNHTARLTPNDPPFAKAAPGSGPRHLAFHPNGRFAYVINEIACTMTACKFDAKKGLLAEIQSVSTLPVGTEMQTNFVGAEVVMHPSGKFLYGSTRGHNSLTVYEVDQHTGRLTLVQNVPCGGNTPRNFNIEPSGRYLLCANQDSGNITVFAINQETGRIAETGFQARLDKPVCVVFVPVE